MGLEPMVSCLKGRCISHYATGAYNPELAMVRGGWFDVYISRPYIKEPLCLKMEPKEAI